MNAMPNPVPDPLADPAAAPLPAPLPVADLVPHRRGMSWLERIVHVDVQQVLALAQVPAQGLFVRAGRLDVWLGIEYMAQAIAAWAGHRARQQGRPVALGFLLGTRRYDARRQSFAAGERLCIQAQCELMGSNGLGVFKCQILTGGALAALASLSVFEPQDGAAFLQSQLLSRP